MRGVYPAFQCRRSVWRGRLVEALGNILGLEDYDTSFFYIYEISDDSFGTDSIFIFLLLYLSPLPIFSH